MTKFKERYDKLNDKQKDAVDTIDGPVLVLAGPGSGKTELLAIRTANILQKTDTLPSSILLLTFTDSASFNMRERLVTLIGEQAYRIGIYTFHSFASDIISKYPEYFFDEAKFLPATDIDQINIVQNIIKELPRKNPLSKFHPEMGHVYLKDVISSIKDLKKGGLTPELFFEKLKQNKINLLELNNAFKTLEEISGKRKYSELMSTYIAIFKNLENIYSKNKNSLAKVLLSTLELAINNASEEEKSTHLTAWKNAYTKKIDGKFICKDAEPGKQEKLEALLGVYTMYQKELNKKGVFDFEDMILLVLEALQKFENLRFDLQEKIQYVMIDEFQDTNDAQFLLVKNILNSLVNEGRPNVLAVGDDDQAIFKFQGAELNNVFTFKNSFIQTKVINLNKNYRSSQDVLDFARNIILKAVDRLEVRDKSVSKEIIAANLEVNKGNIISKSFNSEIFEFEYVARQINDLLKTGVEANEIAVICRKHDQLRKLTLVLNANKIPYSYSKQENVLDKRHVIEILTILKFLNSYTESSDESLLPEILTYDFWQLERLEIWKIAELVKKGTEILGIDGLEKKWVKLTWLEAMQKSSNSHIVDISKFLIQLIVKSRSTPLEYLIDEIIGTTEFLKTDSEYEDMDNFAATPIGTFNSPYKKYYFNNERFVHNKPEYLDFLFSLRTFIGALRGFHQGKVLYATNISEFMDTYTNNNLTLSVVSPFATSENAVSLLTAHKAKGLEFEYVFLLSVDQGIWKRAGFSRKISFPTDLPLSADTDNDDDKIRLLYVAVTRAKHTLYITNHSQKLEYLVETTTKLNAKPDTNQDLADETIDSLQLKPQKIFLEDEKILLKRLLENYKMPVTHLTNFLNFTKVGPEKFIEQNLLRFPQAMSASAAYGSAMHAAVEFVFIVFKKNNKIPELTKIIDVFRNNLERARLPETDFKKFMESGEENLKIYIENLIQRKINPETKVEVKFNNEGVNFDGVQVTGNIDKMEFLSDEIIVTDLKTGESLSDWEEGNEKFSDYEKVKLHFYQYQLAFYALLIENSKTYNFYKIKVGNIEFLEANNFGKIIILPLEITSELKNRVQKLTKIVYEKIQNLDFPDTSRYSQNIKGILEFEEDLINGKL